MTIQALAPSTTAVASVEANPWATKASSTSAPPTSLLPDPQELQGDPLSMLYLFQSQDRQMGIATGTAKLNGLETERHAALKKEQSALKAEANAAKHKSFWDKLGAICAQVAKVAGVVAAVAAAVATCGAGSPLAAVAIAGAVLSSAGFVGSETNVLQKLGLSDKLAGILNTVMSAGGAVASMGSAAAAGASSIISSASAAVSGAGQIGSGAGAIGSAKALSAEDNADADNVASDAEQNNLQRMMTHVVQQVQDADKQSSQLLSTIATTKGIENHTGLIAATGLKG